MEEDIKVNTEVLSTTYPALASEMKRLMVFADGLNRNLSMAAEKFNSENFKRASGILKNTQNNLSDAAAQLSRLKGYFDTLKQFTDQYLTIKW